MDLVLLRLRGDGAEEGDVVVGVEAAEVAVAGGVRAEHSHRGVRASARRLRLSPAADRAVYGRALPHKSEAVEECIRFMNSSSRKYRCAGRSYGIRDGRGHPVLSVMSALVFFFHVRLASGFSVGFGWIRKQFFTRSPSSS